MPGSVLLYRLVPATPPEGATEPLPVTFKFKHYQMNQFLIVKLSNTKHT